MIKTDLPIGDVLPQIAQSLETHNALVLVAPPGAGKTTIVPLAMLDAPWRGDGSILVLEPRRIAARGAATRMANLIGEPLGQRVGLRTRLESNVSSSTRIEVMTEGVFTRRIVNDPELTGVAAVLFDEFHERSLDADIGLAFALETQGALRPDLRIVVMSATLDDGRIAQLLGDAPVLRSEGRAYPVETRYRPRAAGTRIEDAMADAIVTTLASERGSILAFLPGQGEILRVLERLTMRKLPADTDLAPLYGTLDPAEQDAAIRPAAQGRRKVVLATAIAETSLTIEGVRIVIDSGLQRSPRYEPDLGISRLETLRVTRASADQRRGRAGRTEAGVAIRLWEEAEDRGLIPFGRPEILESDLAPFRLDCAQWGVADPSSLALLDPPPVASLKQGEKMLLALGALDDDRRITQRGRELARMPLSPRLGSLVLDGAKTGQADAAAQLAVLVSERGIGGVSTDLAHRVERFLRDRGPQAQRARAMAARWAEIARSAHPSGQRSSEINLPPLLARAFPDRIAKRRGAGQYALSNGRMAQLDEADALGNSEYLIVADMTGSAAKARITSAMAITREEMETALAELIHVENETRFMREAGALRARKLRMIGSLVLDETIVPVEASQANAELLARAAVEFGLERLGWSANQRQQRDRAAFLKAAGHDVPDLGSQALGDAINDWLVPELLGKTRLSEINAETLARALETLLPYAIRVRLDDLAPMTFSAPTGTTHPIRYEGEGAPFLSIRVQELFGQSTHPSIAGGRLPLTLELLSPAHRPIQITRDLPGFWAGSWADVRREMRGRYPKHVWPEDPASAAPTTRAKPRGT